MLKHLLKAEFEVTLLTRNRTSLGELQSGVKVAEVDYDSVDSVASALHGIDAVVSTVSMAAIPNQKTSIEAAIQAGVRRFIPADYGALNHDPACRHFALYAGLVVIQDILDDKAQAGLLEYTRFAVGAFLEYTTGQLLLDIENRSVELVDDGTHPFSTTSVDSVGKAIAGALLVPEETKNKVVFVQDAALTQAQVLRIAKGQVSHGDEWTETHISGEEAVRRAEKGIAEGNVDFHKVFAQLSAALLSGKYKVKYDRLDNELLGLKQLSADEVEDKIVALIKAKRHLGHA